MPKSFDPFDELASMFLTSKAPAGVATMSRGTHAAVVDAGTSAPKLNAHEPVRNPMPVPVVSAAPAQPAAVELLITGNLPVRGNLWLTPYADAMAREAGSTALLRLDGLEPSVQLLRASREFIDAPMGPTVRAAVDQLGQAVDLWIIRTPAGCDPREIVDACGTVVDRVTILTSSDEAAVVAAYQVIKELVHTAEHAGVEPPPVRLAVVGTDTANASGLVERLNRTAAANLGIEIRLAMCLPRMDAGVKSTRYIAFAGQAHPSLSNVLADIQRVKHHPAANVHEASPVAGRLYPDRNDEILTSEQLLGESIPVMPRSARSVPAIPQAEVAAPIAPSAPRPPLPAPPAEVAIPLRTAASNGESKPARTPVIKLAPKPAMLIEGKHLAKPHEPSDRGKPVSLAQHIEGLKPLAARSPGHERIELAVDSEGHIHLLGNEQTLRELPIVEQWVKAHRELLALAYPQHPINTLGKTHCHIFSDKPASLADLHGTNICLHVLAPVIVNGQTAWYTAPLNSLHSH